MIPRYAENYLSHWYGRKKRKPLVIRGARQTGKSTLVRMFAAAKGLSLVEINLERYRNLESVAQRCDSDLLLREIGLIAGRNPAVVPNSLLFLDEIQAAPSLLTMLRYLYEDRPELAVVAAGSLLEFALSDARISMPVGRTEFMHLGPVTFEEYLVSLKEDTLAAYLQGFGPGVTPSEFAHEKLLVLLRDYLLVGGMPEATAAFAEKADFLDIAVIHRSILDAFRDDFSKYCSGTMLTVLRRVFDHVPRGVGRKFVYSHVNPAWTSREIRHAVDLLSRADVIARVHHSHGSGVPLGATVNDRVFKPLFLDIGLLSAACEVKALTLECMRERSFINEGPMAEQFAGQHIRGQGEPFEPPQCYYWLREGRKNNAEVDFLTSAGPTVVPVEVKAGAGGSLRSLHQFVALRGSPIAVRFDLNQPSCTTSPHTTVTPLGKKEIALTLLSLPLYMAGRTREITSRYLSSGG